PYRNHRDSEHFAFWPILYIRPKATMGSSSVALHTSRFPPRVRGSLRRPLLCLLKIPVILLIVCAPLVAAAQTGSQTDDDDVVRVSTDLLIFPIRVRDAKGQ